MVKIHKLGRSLIDFKFVSIFCSHRVRDAKKYFVEHQVCYAQNFLNSNYSQATHWLWRKAHPERHCTNTISAFKGVDNEK